MKTQKGNITAIAIISVIIVMTVGVFGWAFAKKLQAPDVQPVVSTQPMIQPVAPVTKPAPQPTPEKIPTPVANPCDSTENCQEVVQAVISNECAPWDGRAIDISMKYNNKNFRVSIFAKGLDLFKTGKTVKINDSASSVEGTGLANLCSTSSVCEVFHEGQVEVQNPSGIFNETSVLHLNIIIDGQIVPVEAHWNKTVALCG